MSNRDDGDDDWGGMVMIVWVLVAIVIACLAVVALVVTLGGFIHP
jgi:hypothetical protein